MSTAHINTYLLRSLIILLSLSGWITGTFLYYSMNEQGKYIAQMKQINATHILTHSFQNLNSFDEVKSLINKWQKQNWSAQTGSLNTICTNRPQRLIETCKLINQQNFEQLCQ
ncbi:hypothetical protein [Vibrio sagamiensis]|uniref:Uncharacterized protein n=1 Tax=Vibrio sagamiensis NBRC 104589 TaxID=1219064 RepID=A0A511QBJ9_9VIBR|nr:hypothetical protein [Vibrio sagamiensis]GEM74675.1 hypothetical protein VSA01S_07870 [Vibrio sagamiensis NBRC 104589]